MITGTLFTTWLKGEFVGKDQYGNRYFQERKQPKAGQRRRRWVLYSGKIEASKIPPEWHAWLHYTVDEPIKVDEKKPWMKEHLPNLSGTVNAYVPSGDDRRGGNRAKGTGDYEAWTPGS